MRSAKRPLSERLRALRHYLEHDGVPDDLSALDEAVEVAERAEDAGQASLLDPLAGDA